MRPLWEALLEHHGRVSAAAAADPLRGGLVAAPALGVRRVAGPARLVRPGGRVGRRPVGYVLVLIEVGDDTWSTDERVAVIETLSVDPGLARARSGHRADGRRGRGARPDRRARRLRRRGGDQRGRAALLRAPRPDAVAGALLRARGAASPARRAASRGAARPSCGATSPSARAAVSMAARDCASPPRRTSMLAPRRAASGMSRCQRIVMSGRTSTSRLSPPIGRPSTSEAIARSRSRTKRPRARTVRPACRRGIGGHSASIHRWFATPRSGSSRSRHRFGPLSAVST